MIGALTVKRVRELFPNGWAVDEEIDGIAVSRREYAHDSSGLGGIALLMQAAVRLGIDASQIRDETEFEQGAYYSAHTGSDPDEIRYRVVFLYRPSNSSAGAL